MEADGGWTKPETRALQVPVLDYQTQRLNVLKDAGRESL